MNRKYHCYAFDGYYESTVADLKITLPAVFGGRNIDLLNKSSFPQTNGICEGSTELCKMNATILSSERKIYTFLAELQASRPLGAFLQ
ncbi:hypothetical protein NPIL_683141 [Nephila pilipes]|uniref:Uncharacterized protein n=1 Tax=Nephila pilipes TaxID=299642 RepID=A0A8X6PV75_NEPPI|nr:hypothetical protein NPIL_683141 [Nephila pilipes]